MPRTKTKGEPIQIRLPVEIDTILGERALNAAVSRAEMVERLVVLSLTSGELRAGELSAERMASIKAGVDEAHAGKVRPAEEVLAEVGLPCKHPRSMHTALNGGLVKCRCGKVRNMAQEWN